MSEVLKTKEDVQTLDKQLPESDTLIQSIRNAEIMRDLTADAKEVPLAPPDTSARSRLRSKLVYLFTKHYEVTTLRRCIKACEPIANGSADATVTTGARLVLRRSHFCLCARYKRLWRS